MKLQVLSSSSMAREGSGFNEITAHVIEALKDSSEPLKYGVPGWIPDEVRRQVDLHPKREVRINVKKIDICKYWHLI